MDSLIGAMKIKKKKKRTVYPCAFFLMKSLWELLFNQSLGNRRTTYEPKKMIFFLIEILFFYTNLAVEKLCQE